MRVNGAIEGGATAFAVGDEVISLVKYDHSKTYVIGLVNGIKVCITTFKFRLMRGDGSLVDVSEEMAAYIRVTDENWVYFCEAWAYDPTDPRWVISGDSPNQVYTYDDGYYKFSYSYETGYWELWPYTDETDPFVLNPNGYYAYFSCQDSTGSQYPYKYKSADYYNPDNLILPGSYEDIIPYWKIDTVEFVGTEVYAAGPQQSTTRVRSSVTYKTTFNLTVNYGLNTFINGSFIEQFPATLGWTDEYGYIQTVSNEVVYRDPSDAAWTRIEAAEYLCDAFSKIVSTYDGRQDESGIITVTISSPPSDFEVRDDTYYRKIQNAGSGSDPVDFTYHRGEELAYWTSVFYSLTVGVDRFTITPTYDF